MQTPNMEVFTRNPRQRKTMHLYKEKFGRVPDSSTITWLYELCDAGLMDIAYPGHDEECWPVLWEGSENDSKVSAYCTKAVIYELLYDSVNLCIGHYVVTESGSLHCAFFPTAVSSTN